jgi:DNA-binding MarR family transcriptional regulator
MPLGELAAAEAVSAPTMSRIVDSLEAKGLVGRNPDAEDRRMARIGVTDSGRRMLGGARAQSDQYLAAGLAGLDAAERRRLLWALGVLESLAEPGPSAAPPRQRKAER